MSLGKERAEKIKQQEATAESKRDWQLQRAPILKAKADAAWEGLISRAGTWSETKVGTPQGAVISPLLANIYLHYVFDLWVEAWRKKCASGDVIVVRYVDAGDTFSERRFNGGDRMLPGTHAQLRRLLTTGWACSSGSPNESAQPKGS
jgi:hypothetical protein